MLWRLADRLRVRRSSSDERVVGQSGSLKKRRPRVALSDVVVGVVVRRQMLRMCCTKHAVAESLGHCGVNPVSELQILCRYPQGRRSASVGPKGTYVVLASGCCANGVGPRRAAVGVVLTSLGPVTGLSACCGLFGLLWRRTPWWLHRQLDRAERLHGSFFIGCWEGIGSTPPLWRRPGGARAGCAPLRGRQLAVACELTLSLSPFSSSIH